MSYQVLALKWRPQKFEEVVGQDHVTRTLQNALSQGRVPHAFLFTGSRGVGKTTTARLLAKALICEEGPTPDPCGECRFCRDVKEGRSLDVMEIDGASNTGVDNIRELRENAGYAPSAARAKIYIIDEVHMLSTSAFNALLKILEEPPAHVTFIFATTETSKVPVTIQSRCQRFDFRLLTREEILGQLKKIIADEDVEISEEALAIVAAAAEGSLRDSQTLLDQVLAFSGKKVGEKDVTEALGLAEEKTVHEFLGGLLSRRGADCIRIVDRLAGAGYDPRSFTGEVLTGLRHLAVLKTAAGLDDLVPASKEGLERLKALAADAGLGRIQSLFDIFLRTEAEIRGTTFPRMMLELAILRSVRLEEVETLRALVERLEAMEKGLPAPPEQGVPVQEDSPPERSFTEEAPPPPEEGSPPDAGEPPPVPEEAAPPDPPAPPGGSEDLFGRLLKRMHKEGVVIASFLEHGRLTREGEKELEIAFDPGNGLFIETLREPANLILLRRAAREVTGRKVDVHLVSLENGEGEKKKAKESDLKKKHRREALEHPLVQGVIEVFQAQVVDVKLL